MNREKYKLEFYVSPQGEYPIEEFLKTLQDRPRRKLIARFRHLEEMGPDLHRPYADILADKIRELRMSFARLEIRVLFFIHGKCIVLTHGFIKTTQRIPAEEIDLAKRYRSNWINMFGGGEQP